MRKIAFIVSSPMTIKSFLMPFVNELNKEFELHIIANFNGSFDFTFLPDTVITHSLCIERNPSIFNDLSALIKLVKLINMVQFDVVHSYTPKAGLLAQLAAFVCMSKVRFHTFTGQVWVTQSGIKRYFFKKMDCLIGKLSTYNIVDSPSQRDFLIENNVLNFNKSIVLGSGSISGVNTDKFKYSEQKRNSFRHDFNLNENDFVFLYAGRLKADKGIPELFKAFDTISKKNRCKLVIVGIDEEELLPSIKHNSDVIFCGFTDDIASYFSMSDLLCLPSHREGFGNVVIEAASCGLPSLASNIYGLSDAIVDGETGILHDVNNQIDIENKMQLLIDDRSLLNSLGRNAKMRVENNFSEKIIVREFMKLYNEKIL